MKNLILVTSPPACGKTFISKQLAKHMKHVVYLDKDTLIILSKQIFAVANQEYNRSSDFFEENIRDYEYRCVEEIALEALEYADNVLINAPFTQEIRDRQWVEAMEARLSKLGAKLVIIWVVTDPEVCHQRMIARNSDRDTWKLENWDEYISRINFNIPYDIVAPGDDQMELKLFYNSSDAEYEESLQRICAELEP